MTRANALAEGGGGSGFASNAGVVGIVDAVDDFEVARSGLSSLSGPRMSAYKSVGSPAVSSPSCTMRRENTRAVNESTWRSVLSLHAWARSCVCVWVCVVWARVCVCGQLV